jgi:hypothetical protein
MARAINPTASRRALYFAAIAVVSAVLSCEMATRYSPSSWQFQVAPGVIFGLALAAATQLWSTRSIFNALAICGLTIVAWYAAHLAYAAVIPHVSNLLQRGPHRYMDGTGVGEAIPFTVALAGIAAGFVGSIATWFAVAVVHAEYRSFRFFLILVCFGAIAGSLLEGMVLPSVFQLPFHIGSLKPVFIVWQTGVAALIGYQLRPVQK